MPQTRIHELNDFGQSAWLDYISCSLITTGRLAELIDMGVSGITSNPTIFNQSISASSDYDEAITALSDAGNSPFEIYDALTIYDIREVADAFMPIYMRTDRTDGYVSLEVNPKLAMDADASIAEGMRLFRAVGRPNVMIKIPATEAGYHIIEELLAAGVNVNATLIFSVEQYVNTVWAYFKGMNRLSHNRDDLAGVRSVASVFVSRVDTAVDNLLISQMAHCKEQDQKSQLAALLGTAAVANAQLIFEKFTDMFSSDLFRSLSQKNAQIQRLLWASTSTKNPQYSDIKYVTELIARRTVNTMPESTVAAFVDHGIVREALIPSDTSSAHLLCERLSTVGINLNDVCSELIAKGVAAFEQSFDELLASLKTKAKNLCPR